MADATCVLFNSMKTKIHGAKPRRLVAYNQLLFRPDPLVLIIDHYHPMADCFSFSSFTLSIVNVCPSTSNFTDSLSPLCYDIHELLR